MVEVDPEAELTIEQLLDQARAKLDRLTPAEASAAHDDDAILIDVRSELQRSRDGELPGARCIARNVLEWRLDPSSPDRDMARGGPSCRGVPAPDLS